MHGRFDGVAAACSFAAASDTAATVAALNHAAAAFCATAGFRTAVSTACADAAIACAEATTACAVAHAACADAPTACTLHEHGRDCPEVALFGEGERLAIRRPW